MPDIGRPTRFSTGFQCGAWPTKTVSTLWKTMPLRGPWLVGEWHTTTMLTTLKNGDDDVDVTMDKREGRCAYPPFVCSRCSRIFRRPSHPRILGWMAYEDIMSRHLCRILIDKIYIQTISKRIIIFHLNGHKHDHVYDKVLMYRVHVVQGGLRSVESRYCIAHDVALPHSPAVT